MLKVNKHTGTIADLPPTAGGGDWVPLNEAREEKKVPAVETLPEPGAKMDLPRDEGEITKKDIMQELDSLGVSYDKKASKKALYTLMMEQ